MLLSTPGLCSRKSRQSVDVGLSRDMEAVAVHSSSLESAFALGMPGRRSSRCWEGRA